VGLLAAGVAGAQTAANIVPWTGNGQLICYLCTNSNASGTFQPISVLVTDASGNPVSGAVVNWSASGGTNGSMLLAAQTTTDATGLASNSYQPAYVAGGQVTTFAQSTITATTAGSGNTTLSTTLTLTQGLPNPNAPKPFSGSIAAYDISQLLDQFPSLAPAQSLAVGSRISGQSGTTSAPPIKVRVLDFNGIPIPNVAITLYNLQPAASGPAVQCGGANAINGVVLTDATGLAVCNPVFGGTPGTGQFDVLVGAVQSTLGDPNQIPPFLQGWQLVVTVTPGQPSSFTLVSGSGQSAQAGQSLASPLVVQVLGSGNAPLSGQTVNWSVTPSGAATLNSSTTTDSNGRASNTVTFSSTASGTVQIKATLAGSTLTPVTFTATAVPNLNITDLNIVSGNNQAAIVGAAFTAPLVVKLVASNGTPSGFPVNFSVSPAGSATLSDSTKNTDSTGTAQVTLTAGATAQAITVTATSAGKTATFNLTISPPGPALTTTSFVNGADLQRGALSPCGLGAVIAGGVAPGVQNIILPSSAIGPLPTTLNGTQVLVNATAAPIAGLGIGLTGQQQITFQVPCETTPGSSVPFTVNVGAGTASVSIPVQAAAPGVFTTLLSDNNLHAVVIRPDGSFVTIQNPARKGDIVTAFLTGLGPSSPAVATGALPTPGVMATPQYQVVVGMSGGGVPLISAQLSPDRVGVWMLMLQVPSNVSTSNGLATFSVSVIPTGASAPLSSGTTTIPVQ
jgi:uncharacterized protein (TIGR03437 family)